MGMEIGQAREKTYRNRSRIFGRFGGPVAESEITVKLLGAKLTKTTTQGVEKHAGVISLRNVFLGISVRRHAFFPGKMATKLAGASP